MIWEISISFFSITVEDSEPLYYMCLSVCPSPTSADSGLRKLGCEKLSSVPRTLNVIVQLYQKNENQGNGGNIWFYYQKQINFFSSLNFLKQSYLRKLFQIYVSYFFFSYYVMSPSKGQKCFHHSNRPWTRFLSDFYPK